MFRHIGFAGLVAVVGGFVALLAWLHSRRQHAPQFAPMGRLSGDYSPEELRQVMNHGENLPPLGGVKASDSPPPTST